MVDEKTIGAQFKEIVLEKTRFVSHMYADEEIFQVDDTRLVLDMFADSLILQIRGYLASTLLDEVTYPYDWWHAFKLRWFPRWLLVIFPARLKKLEARAFYPTVTLPGKSHYIKIKKTEIEGE